ncbi:hypothetical protein ['Camptotheca acuminata' phytoplasma]|uniref:hypothetical protein n=1 Tax='Camptotheca acuminata' phytoplasma TaxID=3239192 RepID=UPI00351A2547
MLGYLDASGRFALLKDVFGRKFIMKQQMDPNIDWNFLAQIKTQGMSGVTLKEIINNAAIKALIEEKRPLITQSDIETAIDNQILGLPTPDITYTPNERKAEATYFAGQAVINLSQKWGSIYKIDITPRARHASPFKISYFDEHQKVEKDYEKEIILHLGGKAAEEMMFNTVSDRVYLDNEKAKNLITDLLKLRKILPTKDSNLAEMQIKEEFEDKYNALYNKTKDILNQNSDLLNTLVAELEKKDVLTANEINNILNERSNDLSSSTTINSVTSNSNIKKTNHNWFFIGIIVLLSLLLLALPVAYFIFLSKKRKGVTKHDFN